MVEGIGGFVVGIFVAGFVAFCFSNDEPRCVYHFRDMNGTMQSIGSVCHASWLTVRRRQP